MNYKVKFKEQFGYFCGDYGGSLINLYIDMWILTFATYVLGIDPKWMAGLFLVARIWDGINDPLIGSLPDRFKIGKSGDRFKPYIRIAMIPLALSCLLIFSDVSAWSQGAKMAWVAALYLIYGMSYTGASMPYGAMASVITDDPESRTKLSRARAIGGMGVGVTFMALIPQLIWNEDHTPKASGYFTLAIIAAAGSLIFYSLLLTLCKENIQLEDGVKAKQKKYSFWHVLKGALTNRPLIGMMIASRGSMFSNQANGSLASYMYREYYHAPKAMSMSSFMSVPVMVFCFIMVPRLSKKFGPRKTILTAVCINIVCSLLLVMFPIANVYVFMFVNTVANIGQTIFIMLTWALVAQCMDYQEYKSNERSDGTLYSIYTFSRKIGTAVASSTVAAMLPLIGFVSGASEQAAAFGPNVRMLAVGLPVLSCLVELLGVGIIYNISPAQSEEIRKTLEVRRAQPETDA